MPGGTLPCGRLQGRHLLAMQGFRLNTDRRARIATAMVRRGRRFESVRGLSKKFLGPPRRAVISPGNRWRSASRVGRSECCLDRGRGAVSIGPMKSLWTSRRLVATAASVPLAALAVAPDVAAAATHRGHRRPRAAGPATIGLERAGTLGKVLVA